MKKKLVAGLILAVVAFCLVLAIAFKPGERTGKGAVSGKGKVGVVYIDGVIASGQSSGGAFGTTNGSEQIAATLREAARNSELKAVVIRLNSPGGTPAASQEISSEVERLRQSGKKVVASMGDMAASGAYWVASGADRIVANPGTLTGSIGVIMEHIDLQGLYNKIGVGEEPFKSGPYKDMGSYSRPVAPEERAIFQSMIDDIYGQFVDTVAKGRNKDASEIRPLADGRIFTGRQAKDLGLVDQLGDFHDAVLLAGELSGIQGEPSVEELGPRNFWRELFAGARGNILWQAALPIFPAQGEAYTLRLR